MPRHALALVTALTLAAAAGCGEDKGYGAPIDDANARASAAAAVANAVAVTDTTTNDTSLSALNALSANLNFMAGAKLAHQLEPDAQELSGGRLVDEGCVIVTDTSVTYVDCDFLGNTVNGTVSRSGSGVSVDLAFTHSDQETTSEIDITADLTVTDAEVSGFVDYDVRLATEGISITTTFDSDFDVTLVDGCAVGGELEVHAVSRAQTESQRVTQDLWVKAEYGPTCGDIVIR